MWVAAESSANQSDQEGRAFSKEFLSPADPDPAAHLKKVSGIHTLLRSSVIVRYLVDILYTLQLYQVQCTWWTSFLKRYLSIPWTNFRNRFV